MEHIALIAWEVIGCLLVADFITGLGHWFEDTYGSPKWPIFGKLIILDNIDHHRRPSYMARMGTVISRNIYQFVIFGVAVGIAWLVGYGIGRDLPWQFYLMAALAALGNETHAWTHSSYRNPVVKFLHDTCLVITPKNHGKHHHEPWDKSFCVLTNWVNPILDGIQFWRGLEWCIALVGIKPNRTTPDRDGY